MRRVAVAEAPAGRHHRTCAKCSGYIDAVSGFYEVTRHDPGHRDGDCGRGCCKTMLTFDGLDCLRGYVTASDEAFPVRERKHLIAPHQVGPLCDWCHDYHWGRGLTRAPQNLDEPCNHTECQCWCVT